MCCNAWLGADLIVVVVVGDVVGAAVDVDSDVDAQMLLLRGYVTQGKVEASKQEAGSLASCSNILCRVCCGTSSIVELI